MPKFALAAAICGAAFALADAPTVGAAANPDHASCEAVVASLAALYAPGTVAYLTHLLQADASSQGVPMGSLNLVFAQSKGACGL